MEKQIDFSQHRHFPGTTGNPFDTFLHRVVELDKLPVVIFAAILLGIAVLAVRFVWPIAFVLWGFFLLDWLLLALLPRMNKSYGPAKPTALILASARAAIVFLIGLTSLPVILSLVLQILGTLLVIYGFWIEPHRLTLTREKLISSKLPHGTKIRMLHLGDLHVERITGRERQLNRMIHELQPDLILFSGDFINLSYLRDPEAWKAMRAVVSEWQAPLGVYAVTGSPAVDLQDVIPGLVKELPNIRLLQDQKVSIPVGESHIDVVGLTCTHKPFIDGPQMEKVVEHQPSNFTILLYHSPDLAPESASLGMDLQLSGHTHGGQVRLPFYGALFAGSLYGKRFEAGRYQVEHMTLYVSRGIGLEGQAAPRVRFLCPPEIIFWEIEGL